MSGTETTTTEELTEVIMEDGIRIVRILSDRVSEVQAVDICSALLRLLRVDRQGRFVIECDNLDILCSALLNQLLLFDKAIKRTGGRWMLSGLKPSVEMVLSATRADKGFQIAAERGDALQLLRQSMLDN